MSSNCGPWEFTFALGTRSTFLLHTPYHHRLLPPSHGARIPTQCHNSTDRQFVIAAESNCEHRRIKALLCDVKAHGDFVSVMDAAQCLCLFELGIDSLDNVAPLTANFSVIECLHTLQSASQLWMLQ